MFLVGSRVASTTGSINRLNRHLESRRALLRRLCLAPQVLNNAFCPLLLRPKPSCRDWAGSANRTKVRIRKWQVVRQAMKLPCQVNQPYRHTYLPSVSFIMCFCFHRGAPCFGHTPRAKMVSRRRRGRCAGHPFFPLRVLSVCIRSDAMLLDLDAFHLSYSCGASPVSDPVPLSSSFRPNFTTKGGVYQHTHTRHIVQP